MSPTSTVEVEVEGDEEIQPRRQPLTNNGSNGDTYKEYGYSRVPCASSPPDEPAPAPTVNDYSVERESVRLVYGSEKDDRHHSTTTRDSVTYLKIQQDDMAEEGSKLLQYVAATAGQFYLFAIIYLIFKFLNLGSFLVDE